MSGISGVATKTSYALFALYMLLESDQGRALLGPQLTGTKAVIFNVKGQDLLHIDRPNAKFTRDPKTAQQWAALGVPEPRPFQSVGIFVPPRNVHGDIVAADVTDRRDDEYTIYGWTPLDFIKDGLLPFIFSDAREDRQISFVVDHVRAMLARSAVPSSHTPGAVFLRATPRPGRDFDKAAADLAKARPETGDGDKEIFDFADMVDAIAAFVAAGGDWVPGTASGTNDAFLRRLWAMRRRLGQLITTRAKPLNFTKNINVVDINTLHDDAQRFVVGAVLNRIWTDKQASGRDPLRFIVVDELNKYAPSEGRSPIKEILVDIAARGRSLGVILIGCQQNASRVDSAIVDNAAIKVVGRLDASHADEYRFLSPELRGRATRFLPGTMVLQQPAVPAPLPILFPFPPYATNPSEAVIPARSSSDENARKLY